MAATRARGEQDATQPTGTHRTGRYEPSATNTVTPASVPTHQTAAITNAATEIGKEMTAYSRSMIAWPLVSGFIIRRNHPAQEGASR